MSVTVKASLLGKDEEVKEIRRFLVNPDVYSSFEKLSRQTAAVFSKLKNSTFSLFYKDEDGDLVAFSSDDELMMGLGCVKDSTFRLFIKDHRDFALHDLLPYIFGRAAPHAPPSCPSSDPLAAHPGITCDGCKGDIKGERYKCSDCKDYDLCSTCKDEGRHSHHSLLLISKPLHEF